MDAILWLLSDESGVGVTMSGFLLISFIFRWYRLVGSKDLEGCLWLTIGMAGLFTLMLMFPNGSADVEDGDVLPFDCNVSGRKESNPC